MIAASLGFQNSWTLATVTAKKGDKYTVTYTAFVDEKGNHDVEKVPAR